MNAFEQSVHDALVRRGCTVLRNGWPDFLVFTPGGQQGYALELKRGSDRLSDAQIRMHAALADFGILTHTVRPEGVDALLRRKGRQLLFGSTLEALNGRVAEIDGLKRRLDQAIGDLRADLDSTTALFDEHLSGQKAPPTNAREPATIAELFDRTFVHGDDGVAPEASHPGTPNSAH
ncbi:MAG: VRR-NUC domain-containing protein [Acidimicrobiales bacterium]|nr:VRR-NUC domain-containing protein [Acidimicrobiales bacterium]